MGTGSILIFLLAGAAWYSVRVTFRLTEIHRRIMWASTLTLMVLPAFLNFAHQPWVATVMWPFLAGIIAGEVSWERIEKWKLNRKLARREARAKAKRLEREKQRATHEE